MNSFKLYFRLAWFLKTPFILLLDTHYKPIPIDMIAELCKAIGLVWGEDFSDCDDFAWLFKAEAIKRGLNGVGFVIGRLWGKGHAWNVALTDYGIFQVEPQNAMTFQRDKTYRAWLVII